jgi:serine/threonine protein kinase
MPDANSHIPSFNVAGTLGYIAPEYFQTMNFTEKCDIYSFGVLLGVLVVGKLPSDNFFQETKEMSLVKWVRNAIKSDNPRQALDPKLLGNGFEVQMLLVLKISYFCCWEDPTQRRNSEDVKRMLSEIRQY